MDLIDCQTGFQGKHFAASEFQNTLADDATTKTNRLKVHVFTIIQSQIGTTGKICVADVYHDANPLSLCAGELHALNSFDKYVASSQNTLST